jgi:hypothetical protein
MKAKRSTICHISGQAMAGLIKILLSIASAGLVILFVPDRGAIRRRLERERASQPELYSVDLFTRHMQHGK